MASSHLHCLTVQMKDKVPGTTKAFSLWQRQISMQKIRIENKCRTIEFLGKPQFRPNLSSKAKSLSQLLNRTQHAAQVHITRHQCSTINKINCQISYPSTKTKCRCKATSSNSDSLKRIILLKTTRWICRLSLTAKVQKRTKRLSHPLKELCLIMADVQSAL